MANTSPTRVCPHCGESYTKRDLVPVEPLRAALRELGMPTYRLAKYLGINERSIRRLMGTPDYMVKNGKRYGPYFQKTILYDRAVRICDAAGLDYVAVGV